MVYLGYVYMFDYLACSCILPWNTNIKIIQQAWSPTSGSLKKKKNSNYDRRIDTEIRKLIQQTHKV